MKVELHLHTSRHSPCAIAAPHELMRRLIECGYGAVYLTEHDEVWDEWELADLRANFPQIRIFGGVEISLGDDGMQHLLVLGTTDRDYLRIPTPEEVILHAREQGCLTVLAHPYRWPTSPPHLLAGGVLPDAIELHTNNHSPACADLSAESAARLGLPAVNAGDVHFEGMINRHWIDTFEPLEAPGDILAAVRTRAYHNRPKE